MQVITEPTATVRKKNDFSSPCWPKSQVMSDTYCILLVGLLHCRKAILCHLSRGPEPTLGIQATSICVLCCSSVGLYCLFASPEFLSRSTLNVVTGCDIVKQSSRQNKSPLFIWYNPCRRRWGSRLIQARLL